MSRLFGTAMEYRALRCIAALLPGLALALPAFAEDAAVSVDLGTTDASAGLTNTQRGDNSDGENDAVTVGPEGDQREGRVNRGDADNDFPDNYTYFAVLTPEVKSSQRIRISATFLDDASFSASPVTVRLHYTNSASTGPQDIPNTFAGHPESPLLSGTGRWVRLTWRIADAGFRTFMQGTSDFRFDFGGSRVCADRVDVSTDPEPPRPEEHWIGAHYYPWYYPNRWNYQDCVTGALRLELDPAQRPALGKYDSITSSVVDQHLRWCAEYGVNVVILEFISPGSREDQICRNVILRHPRSADVKFCVLYDWAIRFQAFEITEERLATARADFKHLAGEYFPHASYLKVGGKFPLAMIYVTRALSGDVEGLKGVLKDACASEGSDVFLVGDEFLFPSRPNPDKIGRWDGIFGYDAYAGQGGYWGENGKLDLFRTRTAEYAAAARDQGVKFFPSCAPGFNDRSVRRVCANNPALPRRVTPGDGPTSLFREVFTKTALQHLDDEFPLVSITSFNEWHEDTEIEPTAGGGPPTAADKSASGSAYTQGYTYDDFGLAFLELIRDATLAATGRILGPGGTLAGARIEVLDSGGKPVLVRKSFTTGAYVIPRLLLETGRQYRLKVSFAGMTDVVSPPFTVLQDRAVTGFDVRLATGPLVSRGDCNGDEAQDISDPIALLEYLFLGGRLLDCLEACDTNDDGAADISDAVYLLGHLFLGGPAPDAPAFPSCEPVPEALQCTGGNCEL
jgi:glycoprotein endo-alpha-1,2-mannosidase